MRIHLERPEDNLEIAFYFTYPGDEGDFDGLTLWDDEGNIVKEILDKNEAILALGRNKYDALAFEAYEQCDEQELERNAWEYAADAAMDLAKEEG